MSTSLARAKKKIMPEFSQHHYMAWQLVSNLI